MIGLILPFLVATVWATTSYELHLTWEVGKPDGFEREMIFVNRQFPGPVLEINEGDNVEIHVINEMPIEAAVHYHGIEQVGTPWADGVPGVSQHAIPSGESFTSRFTVSQYGSYFYHAHARGQIDDGLYGPIVIKPKPGTLKPFDKIRNNEKDIQLMELAESQVKPVILSDWRHQNSTYAWQLEVSSGIESAVCMDSLLINGKGSVDCWPREMINKYTNPTLVPILQQFNTTLTDKGCIPAAVFPYLLPGLPPANLTALATLPPQVFDVCTHTKGSTEVISVNPRVNKWLALDLISTAGIDTFAFSIDEHPMWVYAVDGHYIEPLLVDVIDIANGDRYSVFVELDKPTSSYGIRSPSIALPQLITTTAILSYAGGYNSTVSDPSRLTSTPYIDVKGANTTADVVFFDQTQMVSFPPAFPWVVPEASQTFVLTLQNSGASYIWALNGTAFSQDMLENETPLLYTQPAPSYSDNHTITTNNGTWVDLIFNVATVGQPPHPIHKHANKGFIIGQGTGLFTYTSVAQAMKYVPDSFNFKTPPYRDGWTTPNSAAGPTWLAVRYQVVNPGAWLIHCHIQSHLNGGMAMVILDGADEWPVVPEEYKN